MKVLPPGRPGLPIAASANWASIEAVQRKPICRAERVDSLEVHELPWNRVVEFGPVLGTDQGGQQPVAAG